MFILFIDKCFGVGVGYVEMNNDFVIVVFNGIVMF